MNYFSIGGELEIKLPQDCINSTVKELIYGFLYRSVNVRYVDSDVCEVIIGSATPCGYSGDGIISVTETGAFIGGRDERALLTYLFMALSEISPECLDKGKELLFLPCRHDEFSPALSRRMLHVCLFPRIPLSTYKKIIRLAGVLGFTHLILEFWGTLKYDCLNELAWKNESFTKSEIAELIEEMRSLHIQPIPMINHFGHASASRMAFGKHVVLDQNPRLATLFSNDGWWWRFDKQCVRELLKSMRSELYGLFGKGEYFHIGFDESFSYPTDEAASSALCDYVGDICREIISEGRIPLLWGDLFLHEKSVGIKAGMGYEGNCISAEMSEKMIRSLPSDVVICDWQYFVKQAPWVSTEYFRSKGVKVMVCPWFDKVGVDTAIATAGEFDCFGMIQTTWDKLFAPGTLSFLFNTYYTIFGIDRSLPKTGSNLANASLLRKIWFADGDYESAGWLRLDVSSTLTI